MAVQKFRVYQFGGLNVHTSPFMLQPGELISCINVDPEPHGAKTRREGYTTYLGTADGSTITDLFNWQRNDGTTFYNYRVSGGKVWYSSQGTSAWAICGNGTVSGANVGHAVLNDTLFIGDGAGSTRHSTNGTSFTNTTGAPIGEFFASYKECIYIAGTASFLHKSTSQDGTNWNLAAPDDSTAYYVGDDGKLGRIFVANDKLVLTKNNNRMYRWDGYSIINIPTNKGPESMYAFGEIENYWLWLNRNGYYAYSGYLPEVISIPIEHQITGDTGGGMAGTAFAGAKGIAHRYEYYNSVGDLTETVTGDVITNCVHKYQYLHNEWSNNSYYDKPYSWCSFRDINGVLQLVFGSTGGQCYQIGGNSDNGQPVNSTIQGVLNFGNPDMDKKFSFIRVHFNPGCSARMQVAIADTFGDNKNWIDMGDLHSGFKKLPFPQGSRGKLLFYKIVDSSTDSRFTFFGMCVDEEEQGF